MPHQKKRSHARADGKTQKSISIDEALWLRIEAWAESLKRSNSTAIS